MNRIRVINTIIARRGARTYLEIGVKKGLTFRQVEARVKVGVDPGWPGLAFYWYLLRTGGAKFFRVTSDTFFEKRAGRLGNEGIDVALVDGLHEYHQSLRDVQHCLEYLSPDGAIVMHDCNPQSESAARPVGRHEPGAPGYGPGTWNGDVYKTIVYLRSQCSDLRVFVLDCDHGVGVITRRQPEGMLNMDPAAIEKMTYADLEKDRTHILNLKPADYLHEFLAGRSAR